MMHSLYIGASGLKSHGEGMGVITNNLANVNTLAYKQSSMSYADLMSQYMTVGSGNLTGISQMGMGSAPGAVRTLFEQGGVEAGSGSTDLFIKGGGFFAVTNGDKTHYTRAGNFRFDKSGALLDANGWNVLGRPLNGSTSANPQEIVLDLGAGGVGTMPGKASSVVSTSSNLGGLKDASSSADNPFFAMAAGWNGTGAAPLGPNKYSYSEPVEFYDSNGELHTATIYYDLAGSSNGNTAVEYVLAMNPSEDGSALAGTRASGLLMAGTVTFASDGSMTGMTAFTPPASGDPADLAGWTPAMVQDGQALFTAQPNGAGSQSIALDMSFTLGASGASGGLASAAEAAANPEAVYARSADGKATANASISRGETPSGIYASNDGYPEGALKDVSVSADGVISGVYSNGQSQELYQLSLYRFTSQDGLRHEGNSHYSATAESGPAEEGTPGTENFGAITANSLEQSNVDYAREFSLLMVTQRGFQMNSKVITTSDTMLQKALELKR